jgi:hypothetical protein
MPLRLGPITIPFPGTEPKDPYWDFFMNAAPQDMRNFVPDMMKDAPEGNIFPTKADIHTPEITAQHLKELALFLGSEATGVARLGPGDAHGDQYPFAVVFLVKAEVDPQKALGFGGQTPVQNGQYITFVASAYIRELGFHATAKLDCHREQMAVAAGLGTVNNQGRFVSTKLGPKVHIADVIFTDLPLAPDR